MRILFFGLLALVSMATTTLAQSHSEGPWRSSTLSSDRIGVEVEERELFMNGISIGKEFRARNRSNFDACLTLLDQGSQNVKTLFRRGGETDFPPNSGWILLGGWRPADAYTDARGRPVFSPAFADLTARAKASSCRAPVTPDPSVAGGDLYSVRIKNRCDKEMRVVLRGSTAAHGTFQTLVQTVRPGKTHVMTDRSTGGALKIHGDDYFLTYEYTKGGRTHRLGNTGRQFEIAHKVGGSFENLGPRNFVKVRAEATWDGSKLQDEVVLRCD